MKNNSYLSIKKIISIFLSLAICFSLLSGCGKTENTSSSDATIEVNTEEIVEKVTEEIIEETNKDKTKQDVISETEEIMLSEDWQDYEDDFETFVYGLIINQLSYKYDVFPASVELSNGVSVSGIAYTDYSECYTNDDNSHVAFLAGLIPYYGELELPQDEFDKGLSIENLDFVDDNTDFVLAYQSSEFLDHCVVYEKYLKYGVDSAGRIDYEVSDFIKEECDESLGSLYSYDEEKYLLDTDVGNYVSITGVSLSEQIDFDNLQEEIDNILAEQDKNFASVDIETNAYLAQEAINNYLLSLQEETFLGFDVKELVELSKKLDPMECYRFVNDELSVISLEVGEDSTTLVKCLVGTGCVILTAVGIVGSYVFIECPPLSAASGAIAGVAIDIFMQVVVSGKSVSSIEWSKVAIAAATGAISGYVGPYMLAEYEGLEYFLFDSALDGLLGGMESAIEAWMDGEDGIGIAERFGKGFAIAFAISGGIKLLGKGLSKIAEKLGPSVSKLGKKMFPNLSKKVSGAVEKLGGALSKLKKVADSSPFHSEYIAKKLAERQIERLVKKGSTELLNKSKKSLSALDILDDSNKVITKDELVELFNNAADGDVLAHYDVDGEIINIVKKNGAIGIVFDKTKYQNAVLDDFMVANRDENFKKAAEKYLEDWKVNPDKIPASISQAIKEQGKELEEITADGLVDIIQKSDWVMHENLDLKTITLVPRALHDKVKHLGGFAIAKHIKKMISTRYFDRLLSYIATIGSQEGD